MQRSAQHWPTPRAVPFSHRARGSRCCLGGTLAASEAERRFDLLAGQVRELAQAGARAPETGAIDAASAKAFEQRLNEVERSCKERKGKDDQLAAAEKRTKDVERLNSELKRDLSAVQKDLAAPCCVPGASLQEAAQTFVSDRGCQEAGGVASVDARPDNHTRHAFEPCL